MRGVGPGVAERRFAAELDAAIRASLRVPFDDAVRRFETLRRRSVATTRNASLRLAIRRRIAEWLVEAARDQPWPVFLRYVRRVQRIGFEAPHVRVDLALRVVAVAERVPEGREFAVRFVASTRRALAKTRMKGGYRREQEARMARLEQTLNG